MSIPAKFLGAALVLACAAAIVCPARSLAKAPPAAEPRPTLKVEILQRLPAPEKPESDSPEAKIERALEARVRVDLVDAPLGDVCRELGRQLGINIVADQEALGEMDLEAETPLTFSCDSLPLKRMLAAALERFELTWMIRDEVLQITSTEAAEECRALRLYDVADLVTVTRDDGSYDFDFGPLVDLITGTIEPESWVDLGGSGTCESFEADRLQVLVIRQIGPMHEKIEELLAGLRAHISKNASEKKPTAAPSRPDATPRVETPPSDKKPPAPEGKILRSLQKRISVDLKERPLAELVAQLEKTLAIPIRLDIDSLEEMNLGPDTPVTVQISDISAQSILAYALRPFELAWTIQDEGLLICTQIAAEEQGVIQLYDVGDLVECPGADPPARDFDRLAELITASVEPDSWDEYGGNGTIGPFEGAGARVLVISTTWPIHEEIKDLLALLRKTRREGHGRPVPQRMKPAEPRPVDGKRADKAVGRHENPFNALSVRDEPSATEPAKATSPKPEPEPELKIEVLSRPAAPEKPADDTAEAKIERALEARVRVDLVDAPLDEFCRELAKKLGINVVLDPAALAEFNMPPDEWLTFSCRELPVKTMLTETLKTIEFAWIVDCEVLLVTTRENAEDHAELRVYDVADLVTVEQPDGTYDFDFDPLISLIVASIESDSWVDMGGNGACEPFEAERLQVLVVRQPRSVHEEIDQFLAALRSHLPKRPAGNQRTAGLGSRPATGSTEAHQPTEFVTATPEERIHRLLDKRISIDLEDIPLTEFAARMAKVLGIPVRLDTETLEEAAIPRDSPITIRLTGVSVRHVLELAIRPLDLGYVVTDDAVVIACPACASENLTPVIYDVADLVDRPADRPPMPDFEPVIELISSVVEPDSWEEMGGNGRITPFEGGGARVLVIRQTWSVHDEIEELLAALRKTHREGHGRPLPARVRKPARLQRDMGGGAGPIGRAPRWSSVRPPAAVEKNPDRDELVRGGDRFAFDLYAKLRDSAKGQNLFFSPMSVSTALAMAQAGARGATADEMARAMHFTLRPERLHPACGSLLAASTSAPGIELSVANRLWVPRDCPVLDEFSQLLDQYYGAEAESVDFAHRPDAALRAVERWTARATRSPRPPLARYGGGLSGPTLPKGTTMVLANAIYFKGRWSSPFERSATTYQSFHTEQGPRDVALMQSEDHDSQYAQIEDPPMQILERPYVGEDLSMIVLLPADKPGALAAVEARLTADNLAGWLAKLKRQAVMVYLPSFRMDTAYRLNEPLEALGMKSAFGMADFSGIDGGAGDLFLAWVAHNAMVEVDEEGTKAAAFTMGGMGGGMGAPEPTPVFRADRPFIFVIRDRRTGSILFLGRLVMPGEENRVGVRRGAK